MKKNCKMHPGFSIAELLMSLFIVMIIATAVAPIVGPKKVRNADARYVHGIAECYWRDNADGSQTLMYYYADNTSNRNAVAAASENQGYCTFNIPKAAHYEIYAIGAGSFGAGTDGTDIGASLDNTPRFSGNINLRSYTESTVQNTINNMINSQGGNATDLGAKYHYSNFGQLVTNSITRWAAKLNHASSFNDEITDYVQYDEEELKYPDEDEYHKYTDPLGFNTSGKYLYAEFKGIRGPIGSAGGGYSRVKVIDQPGYPDGNNNACNGPRCEPLTRTGCTKQPKIDGTNAPYWLSSDDGDAKAYAIDNNTGHCYYYLHAMGGNSDKPIGMNENNSIYFPIDGTSTVSIVDGDPSRYEGESTDDASTGHNSLQISITTTISSIANNLALSSSAPGRNGTLEMTQNSTNKAADGTNSPNFALCTLRNITTNKVKTNLNGTSLSCSDFSELEINPDGVRDGVNHGYEWGNGGLDYPSQRGLKGNPGITAPNDNIFTWRFTEPLVRVKYGPAGIPGDIKPLTFSKLSGTLYLFPGRHNHNNPIHTRVSTDAAGSHVILTADSKQNSTVTGGDDTYSINDIENGRNPLYPPDEILNLAIGNHDRFATYISKLHSLIEFGLKDGLLAPCKNIQNAIQYAQCIENLAYPGFAGAGAYPLLTDTNYQNTLTLINNQSYAQNLGSYREYRRTFDATLDESAYEPECHNSHYERKEKNNDNGGTTYYCVESGTSQRRDGAVIIIW